MSVPNQKIVEILSAPPCNKENLYTVIALDILEEATLNIRGEALRLWLYFVKNRGGYTFELSQRAAETFGIKRDSYYTAVNKLIDAGYLVPKREGSNYYFFRASLTMLIPIEGEPLLDPMEYLATPQDKLKIDRRARQEAMGFGSFGT